MKKEITILPRVAGPRAIRAAITAGSQEEAIARMKGSSPHRKVTTHKIAR